MYVGLEAIMMVCHLHDRYVQSATIRDGVTWSFNVVCTLLWRHAGDSAPFKYGVLLSTPCSRAVPRPKGEEDEDEDEDSKQGWNSQLCDWAGAPESWTEDLQHLVAKDEALLGRILKLQAAIGSDVLGIHIVKANSDERMTKL